MSIDEEYVYRKLKEHGVDRGSVTNISFDKKSKIMHVGLKHFSYLEVSSKFGSSDIRFRYVSPEDFESGVLISENILIFDSEKEKFLYV